MTIQQTDTGLLVYTSDDCDFAACITLNGLRTAHDSDLRIGCHPYSGATAWVSKALLPTLRIAIMPLGFGEMVDDWMEFCDDVFARYAEHSTEESIASSAHQVGVIGAEVSSEVEAINAAMHAEAVDLVPMVAAMRPLFSTRPMVRASA